jgi:salicylate hydroxylase
LATSAPILIVGGGIGGITAALCCARQGLDVEVFEQAPQFTEVGAGIQLSPNCTRVLHDLGLEGSLRATAFLPEGGEMRAWDSGKVLGTSTLGESARKTYGFPYYHIHRADLMTVLTEAAAAEPKIQLHTNAEVKSVTHDDHGATLQANGQRHAGAALVGADGIHSIVRESLFGPEAPTFTGNVAWRMLVPAERLPAGMIRPMATAWWGPHKHFVHYYVRAGTLVNCVCVVEKPGWQVESWSELGDHAELKRDFAGWHNDIQTLIDNADPDSCYKWALLVRPPMSQWSAGRATLLGDACHPTLPFMAQGAAMAIEDAAVLARCVANAAGDQIPAALQRYEQLRQARTARIQAAARRNARIFHLGGILAWLRNLAVQRAANHALDQIFSYDALSAAAPPVTGFPR